jgi:hypothetical protein
MTRSIFDPNSAETERSGSRNLGADAEDHSHMPTDVTDGKVSEQEAAEAEAAPPLPPTEDVDEEARRLESMPREDDPAQKESKSN